MTREKFIEELNFNCKVDGKEVWLNIMPCLEKLLDEHGEQLQDKDDEIDVLKHRAEEAMKPKTCEWCKYLDGVICKHDRGLYCVRQFEADYFVKDIQC